MMMMNLFLHLWLFTQLYSYVPLHNGLWENLNKKTPSSVALFCYSLWFDSFKRKWNKSTLQSYIKLISKTFIHPVVKCSFNSVCQPATVHYLYVTCASTSTTTIRALADLCRFVPVVTNIKFKHWVLLTFFHYTTTTGTQYHFWYYY